MAAGVAVAQAGSAGPIFPQPDSFPRIRHGANSKAPAPIGGPMRTPLRLTRNTLVLLAGAGLVLARPALAQRGSAGLIGKIFDERTNEAMADALIFVASLRHQTPPPRQGPL